MKKTPFNHALLALALVLVLVLTVGVAPGCGDDEDEATDTDATEGVMEDDTEATDEESDDAMDADADADGAELYATNCAGCHGPDGEGGAGPEFAGTDIDQQTVEDTLDEAEGTHEFAADLSDDEIEAIADHVANEVSQ